MCYYVSIFFIGTYSAWYLNQPLDIECVIATGSLRGRPYKRARFSMITQAIKRWLNKLFGWLSGRITPETEYARVRSSLNQGITQEPAARIDGIVPQSGVAPLFAGQGETSRSTINEWPERVVQPPSIGNEKVEQPPASAMPAMPPLPSATPPVETVVDAQSEASLPAALPPALSAPTPEQKLEFLHYLVKRGIVNEGFAEGQVPKQYRK